MKRIKMMNEETT